MGSRTRDDVRIVLLVAFLLCCVQYFARLRICVVVCGAAALVKFFWSYCYCIYFTFGSYVTSTISRSSSVTGFFASKYQISNGISSESRRAM